MKKNVKQMLAVILTLVIIVTCAVPVEVNAAGSYVSVESIDFTDFSNWRSGVYHCTTGKYIASKSRICLNNYVIMNNSKYQVYSSNSAYRVLVRQLDSSMSFIRSDNLANGQYLTVQSNAKYLAISAYKYNGESNVTYDTWKQQFANGLQIGIRAVVESTDETVKTDSGLNTGSISVSSNTQKQYSDVEDIDFTDFSNWRSGVYNCNTGKYSANACRLCLNDYVTMVGSQYDVYSSDKNFHVLIREMNSDMKVIKSCNLADGAVFTPHAQTKYLAISIYKVRAESSLSYDSFKTLFQNGMQIGIRTAETDTTADSVQSSATVQSKAVTVNSLADSGLTNDEKFKAMLLQMLITGDTSEHSVSEYGYEWQEVSKLYYEVVQNEGRVAYASCFNMYYSITKSGKTVQTIKLENIDSGYVDRYYALQAIVDDIKEQAADMTDLEKVILAHDYVASRCTYSTSGNLTYTAAGALVNGKALCAGYARAMVLLLQEMGIESKMITNKSHAWVALELNGNWYHADPTWDNTRSKQSGEVSHEFLLRTDSEFKNAKSNKHTGWDGTISTDTTYTNWAIHDVIGELKRDSNKQWYYIRDGVKTIVNIEP